MNQNLSVFFERLRRGPAILLLGQDYLRLESGEDPFLREVLKKYGGLGQGPRSYRDVLQGTAHENSRQAFAWMYELSKRLTPPVWLETVAAFPWNGIMSSAFDSVWMATFRNEWRETQPIYSNDFFPTNPRNPRKLTCAHLFGGLTSPEDGGRPPLTAVELIVRRPIALSLLGRLRDLLTPLGVLAIEGYTGNGDFLTIEDLVGTVGSLEDGQVHLFNAATVSTNETVRAFAEAGKIVLHDESLASCLQIGADAGIIQLEPPDAESAGGPRVDVNNTILSVPKDVWNIVGRSASVLDDSVLETPRIPSGESRYQEFRRFLAESSSRPVWSGYSQNLNFERAFERTLYQEVTLELNSKKLQEQPIILHGQSGSGKSVALGHLAHRIRREGKYPVMFIQRRNSRPQASDIETFCKWIERRFADETPKVLVVWDGMVDPNEYADFLRQLNNRPNKVVLVGSTYRIEEDTPNRWRKGPLIEAPGTFVDQEPEEFARFLKGFDESLPLALDRLIKIGDESFLVALYRLLPASRHKIQSGLVDEAAWYERWITDRLHNDQPRREVTNGQTLGSLLRAALERHRPDLLQFAETSAVAGERYTQAKLLLALVMAPGKFGLKVPVELLLRAIGSDAQRQVTEAFNGADIVRWEQDDVGNVTIGPRHRLEAEEIIAAWGGGPQGEIEIISRLLLELRDDSWIDGREIQFAVDVLDFILQRYKDYYGVQFREIADTLRQLRTDRGVENERLILKEANALREWVQFYKNRYLRQHPDAEECLEQAEDALVCGLDMLDASRKRSSDALRISYNVEMASVLGARAVQVWDRDGRSRQSDVLGWFRSAKEYAIKAWHREPTQIHAIDVVAWLTRDLLKAGGLSGTERYEAGADFWDLLAQAEMAELGDYQTVRLQSRRMELAQLLALGDEADAAFEALQKAGSTVGYYLRARKLAGSLLTDLTHFSEADRRQLREAAEVLEENRGAVVHDARCLRLLLQLRWATDAGTSLLRGEHQSVPFDRKQWKYFSDLLEDLNRCGETGQTVWLQYVHAVALFHLGYMERSWGIFRELEQALVRGARKHKRIYVLSDSEGHRRLFTGTVTWVGDDRGRVYVEELMREVDFLPRHFHRNDIQKGEALPDFCIAFNLYGPIADPNAYYDERGASNG